jgi:tetratricopeptide (TPR) repeat protein
MKWRGLLGFTIAAAIAVIGASSAQERFDNEVRDDMFRAFGGNEAALKNALSVIEQRLSEQPNHAEALVWRGAARYWKAGQAFAAGDIAGGQALAATAMVDLDRAISLQPNNIGVLVPRAAVLLVAARNQRDPVRAQELAARAAADYETALAMRQRTFDRLGEHNRGEYLSGLAESWALAGNRAKAETYLQRILAELPNSPYASRATAKLADWGNRQPLNCQSCH